MANLKNTIFGRFFPAVINTILNEPVSAFHFGSVCASYQAVPGSNLTAGKSNPKNLFSEHALRKNVTAPQKAKKASNDQLTFMRIKNVESKNQMVSL